MGTFSVAFCPSCRTHLEDKNGPLMALVACEKFENALAKSTMRSMLSKIKSLEQVLFDVLGTSFEKFLPTIGTVDKNLIQTFLWARAAEGATR